MLPLQNSSRLLSDLHQSHISCRVSFDFQRCQLDTNNGFVQGTGEVKHLSQIFSCHAAMPCCNMCIQKDPLFEKTYDCVRLVPDSWQLWGRMPGIILLAALCCLCRFGARNIPTPLMGGDVTYMYGTFLLVRYLKICPVHFPGYPGGSHFSMVKGVGIKKQCGSIWTNSILRIGMNRRTLCQVSDWKLQQ